MSAATKAPKRKAVKRSILKCTLHQGNESFARISVPYGHGPKVKELVKKATTRDCLQFNREFAGQWSVHLFYVPALVEAGVLHTSQDFTMRDVSKTRTLFEGREINDAHLYGDFVKMDLDNFDATKVPLAHPLYKFQQDGVSSLVQALREGGALLADDMGLGKTIQSMATAVAHGEKLLVICPASLVFNWCSEVFAHAPAWRVYLHNFRGGTRLLDSAFGIKHRNFTDIPEQAEVMVLSYDAVKTLCVDTPEEEQTIDRRMDIHEMYKDAIKDRILIVDEAHYAKNPAAKRTQAALAASRIAHKTLAMTGTPILNRPAELWPILTLIGRENEIAPDWYAYEQWYVKNSQYLELNRKMTSAKWFVRRLKEDVLTDLPKKRRGEMTIQMPSDLDSQYRAARQGLSRKGLKMANALAILTELQTIANEAKVAPLCDYLRDRSDSGKATVVQSTRSAPLKALASALEKEKVRVALVYGGTSKGERQRLTEAFQRGDIDVYLTTVGEGLTLTRADTLILLDLDWNPGKISQREDRIHRIGQEAERVQVYRCIAASIDRHKVSIICGKQSMVAITIDGGRNMDGMDTDLQSQVIERLREENEEE